MIPITFGQVREWTGGESLCCPLSEVVQGLSIDSRTVTKNQLFVALEGSKTDGHAYVREAWQKGAVALVRRGAVGQGGPQIRVDSPLSAMGQLLRHYLDQHGITVIGVTGSVGKTSAKELTTAVLRARFVTTASLGNYNTAIGLPLSFFAGEPDATHFVAEMGMSALGEIRQLTAIAPPQVAVITTIGPSHLEKLGSIEAIVQAKGEILEGLSEQGLAVLNYDNPWVRELGQATSHRVAWFGRSAETQGTIVEATVHESFTHLNFRIYDREVEVNLPWLGAHQAYNVAAALLVGVELGVALDDAVRQLESISAQRSRIEMVSAGAITVLSDIYNASPLSSKAALDVLASRLGRRIAVLGDMLELGSEESTGHLEVGRYSKGRADQVLAVGRRSQATYEGAQQVGVDADWVATREEAWDWLKKHVREGDVVLLKASRGMQFEWLCERLAQWGEDQ